MIATPKATIRMKMACQPNNSIVTPPMTGEKAGPIARMIPIRFMILADASLVKRSRTMAREIAIPAAAPTPCRKRAAISTWTFGENSASVLATR